MPVNKIAQVVVAASNLPVTPLLLDSSPPVLSMGRLVHYHNCSFTRMKLDGFTMLAQLGR